MKTFPVLDCVITKLCCLLHKVFYIYIYIRLHNPRKKVNLLHFSLSIIYIFYIGIEQDVHAPDYRDYLSVSSCGYYVKF